MREARDRNEFNDQDDLNLVGEFLYFRYTHPNSEEEELITMTSDALNNGDEESWERVNWYTVLVFARVL